MHEAHRRRTTDLRLSEDRFRLTSLYFSENDRHKLTYDPTQHEAKNYGQYKTVDDLESMADELSAARATVAQKLDEAEKSQTEMGKAMDKMKQSSKDMQTLSKQLDEVKIAVPDAFKTAGENYVTAVRGMSDKIEETFQSTVNSGYRNMYLFQVGANALGLLVLLFYREPRRKKEQ